MVVESIVQQLCDSRDKNDAMNSSYAVTQHWRMFSNFDVQHV